MNKTALITGATDGIGKAIALNLAKQQYSIHVIGRNKERGENVLNQLKEIFPNGDHKLFFLDLAEVDQCIHFTTDYINTHAQLDLLVLNANIAPQKVTMNSQNYDSLFMIGYISRYIFTAKLEDLLKKSNNPRIVHINSLGLEKYTKQINLEGLKNPTYSLLKSINHCYKLSTHMVLNNINLGYSSIPSMVFDPLGVLTNQVLDRGLLFTTLVKATGGKSPEYIGAVAVEQINHFLSSEDTIGCFKRSKVAKIYTPSDTEIKNYQEMVRFSEQMTNIYYTSATTHQ